MGNRSEDNSTLKLRWGKQGYPKIILKLGNLPSAPLTELEKLKFSDS